MRKCIGLLILVMSVTGVSAAQLPGGNVYLGYTYLTSGSPSSGPLSTRHDLSNLNGFLVSGELKLLPWISGVAEYGANFGTERVSAFCEAITPLGEFRLTTCGATSSTVPTTICASAPESCFGSEWLENTHELLLSSLPRRAV